MNEQVKYPTVLFFSFFQKKHQSDINNAKQAVKIN